ncbi:glutathione S-transferase Gst3 [Cryptococcus neoformans MW-RSA852]|nr:glutathione S-transferase Gst3 [Cryptococcus neoformans var. grubii MW-RSA852]
MSVGTQDFDRPKAQGSRRLSRRLCRPPTHARGRMALCPQRQGLCQTRSRLRPR